MKKTLFFALSALVVFVLGSCAKENALTINSSEIGFSNEGGSQSVSFVSNVDWTAASDVDWATINNTSGVAGNGSITITVAPNPAYSTRTGNVTVTAGTLKTIFKITQTEATVFEAGAVNVINADAQQVKLSVTTNASVKVEIASDCASWISQGTKSAPTTTNVILNVAANSGLQSRQGVVTVTTDYNTLTYTIKQLSSFTETQKIDASYLGNSQKMYDSENYCPSTFGQYHITMTSEESNTVVALALNVKKATAVKGEVPTGIFTCDYAADHSDSTFSIKTLDGSEKCYTGVSINETELEIVDGEITITKDESGVYSIAASLMNPNENRYNYSYVGKIDAVADKSLALQVGSIAYKADYNTYFANDNSEWECYFYVSDAISADMPFVYYFSIDFFDGKGVMDPQSLPTGKFTVNNEEVLLTSPYKTGIKVVDNKTAVGGQYGSADYTPAVEPSTEASSKTVAINGGTVDITMNSDGTYNFDFNLDIKVTDGYYDDNWTWIETYNKDFNWLKKFNDVALPVASDNQSRPQPDTDIVFTGNVSINPAYTGYWYGDSYALGGNVFWFGWSTGVEGWYAVTLPLHSKSAWTYEKNYANRFCCNPVPDGVYPFVEQKPTENGDFLCNLKSASKRFKITNGYTGSYVYVNKGSVTIAGGKVTFDVEGPLTLSDGTVTEQVLKYTGWLPNSCMYHQDYHGSNRQSQVVWAEIQ